MKQWDICLFPFAEAGPHPAVIVSSDERCENAGFASVNALSCTSLKSGSVPKPTQVLLDAADGPDWPMVVRCDVMHLLAKQDFSHPLGTVSIQPRRAIARTIIACFRLQAW